MTTALLVDDEPKLLEHLQRLLLEVWPELDIVGRAHNGREALAKFEEELPEVVFLDIRMPGLSGIDVANQLVGRSLVVFTTAYDDYAVQAFEAAAIDYLLKPISAERLQQTVARVQSTLTQAALPDATELHSLLARLANSTTEETSNNLQWIRTGSAETTELVSIDDVVFFQADNKYTSVVTANSEHLVRLTIKQLEERLDPTRFWRIHRGTIVNVADILAAKRDLKGGYAVSLKRHPKTLRASRSYAHRFKQM